MSLKENVTAIKDELSSEEKFFEKMVNFEYLYKKYRFIIWATVIVVLGYFITTAVLSMQEKNRVEEANSAYTVLVKNPKDVKALATLKAKSTPLYDLYMYNQAVKTSDLEGFKALKNSKTYMVADMARYNYAVLSDNFEALKAYANDGKQFKDIAIMNVASTLMKQDKIEEAKGFLEQISETSPFYQQAQLLGHYGIAKK